MKLIPRNLRRIGGCGLLLAVWMIQPAHARGDVTLVLARSKSSPWPAAVAQACLWPVGPAARQYAVAVSTETGQPVGAQIFWAAVGQPIKIIFDCTTQQERYVVTLSEQALPVTPWDPPAAGCLLEVRDFTGGSIETAAAVIDRWQQAKHTQGRGFVPNVFLGINPFGPSENFVARFRGALVVPQTGEYGFATVSDDASVLTVDGQPVASWPGGHGADARAYPQHSGKINLTAGPHWLEYLWIQAGESLTAVAAWKRPDLDRYEVVPTNAFAPVAQFTVVAAPPNYFEWQPVEHSRAGEFALVDYRFTVVASQSNRTYRWSFDDGTVARGPAVTHTFPRPALRQVRLEAEGVSVTQAVNAALRWDQINDGSDDRVARQREQILARQRDQLNVEDLANVSRWAEAMHDADLLTAFGLSCLQRSREFTGAHADLFYALGNHFQEPTVRRYEAAEQALRDVLRWPVVDANLRERIKLRLARLLLDTLGQPDATGQVLAEIQPGNLTDEQRRLLAILRADLVLARGDWAGAQVQYDALGRLGEPDRSRYSVQRQARLESARAFLARHEFAAAENLVRTVEWEVPAERLAPDFSLVLANIHLARQELSRALLRCQRLLLVTNADNLRAEVLFHLVEVERALQHNDRAGQTLQQLLTQYPYSEFAARAKERWTTGKN